MKEKLKIGFGRRKDETMFGEDLFSCPGALGSKEITTCGSPETRTG